MGGMSSRAVLRRKIQTFLDEADYSGLVDLAGREPAVTHLLLQFLYDPQDLLHWRALEGLGHLARVQPGQVRKIIHRLLWLLNEDSGSFGWLAAAALGEIGRNQLSVVQEIIPMFCGFLEEDFSRVPMLWGVGRLAEVHPGEVEEVKPWVRWCLTHPDSQVRALSAWCLGKMGDREAREDLAALLNDEQPAEVYDRGELRPTTVAQAARAALDRLDSGP